MDTFEYAMVLVAVVIGLGLAHLLSGLGQAINRLQDSQQPIRIETAYLCWVGYMFLYLVQFWWWEYQFHTLGVVWSVYLYYFIITYAVIIYLLTTVLVPWQMQGVTSALDQLIAKRYWFFGLLLVATAIDIVDTFLKGADWGQRPGYIAFVTGQSLASVLGMLSENKRVHLAVALVMFSWQLIYSLVDLQVLGAF